MRRINFLLVGALALTTVLTGCKKDDENEVNKETQSFRTKIDDSKLTATTNYNNELFYDSKGDSTVNRIEGQQRLLMFKALDAYAKTGTTAVVDANVLVNMFSNTNSPFTGTYANLNTSSLQLKNVTASSAPDASAVRATIEASFGYLSAASASYAETAENGKAGLLINGKGKYLVDNNGIEWAQVISKTLIGAFQIDYIGNTLLGTGLSANNDKLVDGQKYTELEHNWDVAYGTLTLKPRYAQNATDSTNGGESFIGAYMWEYNKLGYKKIHEAFLKGRAAIINNDKTTLKAQADIIRKEMEFAIANAALGYLRKWKDAGSNNGAAAHALGEGLGFIYSLRFCQTYGADASFSEPIFADLISTGHWNMTAAKVDAATQQIKTKFGI
jgi:hypothetical protein